ncbi:hypothetical protein HTV45_29550 [Streptomyces sp. CHD11]|uniref:hypothetical protein n=1 Tax=Streptomyces sp. CHD11 TaxID=2741325 RepID=UPI001BFC3E6D|nr:hypothetical protein [Streptomyces sp. CHD11]MBT3154970.1 hypothetical protein [Streptomyces sp. CHD11]
MRVMLKATLDTEKSNELLRSGKMPERVKEILDRLQPEAAYFGPLGGRRTMVLVLHMQDSSEVPPVGEPFFSQMNAEVEMTPVMNVDDLRKGLSGLG